MMPSLNLVELTRKPSEPDAFFLEGYLLLIQFLFNRYRVIQGLCISPHLNFGSSVESWTFCIA